MFEILVVPDDRRFAMSVPGGRCGGQMLISRGVVNALSPSELELVCAHEAAHLSLGHRRYLVLALFVEEVFWFWPPSKGSTRTLRLALERWADEVAAGDSSESRGRLRGALLLVAGVAPPTSLAAFSAVDGLMERLNALETCPRRTHLGWWLLVLAPGILVGLVAVYASSRLGHQAYCLMTMPGRCRSP
ncbi:MAG: M48 family metalloprotease [Acidimicrobiales bacterium]|nr:M48 family metalloprotease [Acidimicrobiales bacterium]